MQIRNFGNDTLRYILNAVDVLQRANYLQRSFSVKGFMSRNGRKHSMDIATQRKATRSGILRTVAEKKRRKGFLGGSIVKDFNGGGGTNGLPATWTRLYDVKEASFDRIDRRPLYDPKRILFTLLTYYLYAVDTESHWLYVLLSSFTDTCLTV